MLFYRIIPEQRRKLGLTQAKLSQLSGVSLPFIQLIESGRANPSLEVTQSILSSLRLKFKVEDLEPDWEKLSEMGIPLGNYPQKIKWHKLESEILLRHAFFYVHKFMKRTREQDAIDAYLIALRDHYPEAFFPLKDIEPFLPKKFSGHLIKLRRIVVSRLENIF